MDFLKSRSNSLSLVLKKVFRLYHSQYWGGVLVSFLVLLALLGPVLMPVKQVASYTTRLQSPGLHYFLGTDGLGRDILPLLFYGLRISLGLSLAAVGLGFVVGTSLGLVAGYARGGLDLLVGWLTDILLAFPSILLAIAIATFSGPGLMSTAIAVAIVQIPTFARLSRSVTLSVREQPFVDAVRALGGSPLHIVWVHVLPSSLSPLLVQATLAMGTATLEAAGLGFLGLSAQPPTPELGIMVADAFRDGYALSAPWTILSPGFVIMLMVLSFTLLGDELRDRLDPKAQSR
jgi:peptide/nickel transport system permease protein